MAAVVAVAILVLVSIALDLRKLRRASKLRAIHGVLGAAFSMVVVGGALAMSMALGSAPTATAGQQVAPVATQSTPAPEPELIDTSDITDPTTDIQLPTLASD
ncbi:MAG TPA: hypothetical protein VFT01_11100 [Homoserinimonas sp.]|nr:hypothetical protein [Homoserinimonas sp.]